MFFVLLLSLSALSIAGAAAYFSVFGLAQVFSGAFLSVVIMGSVLEAGKLMAASFLYRFWEKIHFIFKVYLLSAVLVLMLITSMGIAGYLSSAYQQDTISLREMTTLVENYRGELQTLSERKLEMDAQISNMPPDYVTARQRLMESFRPEYERINPRIEFLTERINTFDAEILQTQAKIGPIIFISEVLGANPDKAVIYLIAIIVIVFDPLAVSLTIAANVAIMNRKKSTQKESEGILEEHSTGPTPADKIKLDILKSVSKT